MNTAKYYNNLIYNNYYLLKLGQIKKNNFIIIIPEFMKKTPTDGSGSVTISCC